MTHRFCNSAALLRDGELVGLHRKVYLPTYGLFDEGRFTRRRRPDPDASTRATRSDASGCRCARTSGMRACR